MALYGPAHDLEHLVGYLGVGPVGHPEVALGPAVHQAGYNKAFRNGRGGPHPDREAAPRRGPCQAVPRGQLWDEHNTATDGTTRYDAEYLEVVALREQPIVPQRGFLTERKHDPRDEGKRVSENTPSGTYGA